MLPRPLLNRESTPAARLFSFTALLLASACGSQVTCQEKESTQILRAIESARSMDRGEWFPAARLLGKKAASDSSLRRSIWKEVSINTLGMKFVRIEAGQFVMGPAYAHPLRPQSARTVQLSRSFYICVTETTNEQYAILNPSHKPHAQFSPDWEAPVVGLTWDQIQVFCKQLSDREDVVYRLPTEAEWEYVCRAGLPSPHRYSFGDDVDQLSQYAWHGRSRPCASPVALLRPNAWGVYDMHGNAFELVQDWFTEYRKSTVETVTVDPVGPKHGLNHTLRGGEWYMQDVRGCECGFRYPWPLIAINIESGRPQLRETIGFRIVREVSEDE